MNRITVFSRLAGLVVLVTVAGIAFGQPRRGPELSADRVAERLDTRIADLEKALADMRRVRANLDDGAEPEEAVRELATIHRELLDASPLGDAVRRRVDRGGPAALGGPGGMNGIGKVKGDRQRPPAVELTDEAISAYAEEHLPEVRSWLAQLAEHNGAISRRMSARIRGRIGEIVSADAEDEVLGSLMLNELRAEIGVMRAVRSVRDAGRGLEGEARESLRAALGEQFDAHLAMRRHEIVRTADRIGELEAEIAEREERRETFLDQRIDEMAKRVGVRNDRRPGRP